MLHYATLEIKVEERDTDNEFVATVLCSPIRKVASSHFRIDLGDFKGQVESVENLFTRNAETLRDGYAPHLQSDIGGQMRKTGELLFQATIFKGEILDCYRDSLLWAKQHNRGLCIKLDVCPKLAALPWEFTYDTESEGGEFLCCNRRTPIVRTCGASYQSGKESSTRWPLRMLIVPANPLGANKLDSKGEIERIKEAVSECNGIEVESISDETNTWDALVDKSMSDERVDILHFTMHGIPGALTGVDKHRKKQQLTEEDLSRVIGNFIPRPLLVVINACSAGLPDEEKGFVGLLPRLSERGIPFVVGMQFEISDTAGNAFSEAFYAQLAKGRTVLHALTHARLSICKCYYPDVEDSEEWSIPVLYLNSEDTALVPADSFVSTLGRTSASNNDILKLKIEGIAYRKVLDAQEKKGFEDPFEVLEAAVEFLEKSRGYLIRLTDRGTGTEEIVELRAIPRRPGANQSAQAERPDIDSDSTNVMIINYQGRAYRQLCALARDLQVADSPADVVALALELYTATIGKEVCLESCDGEIFRVQL